MHVVVQIIEISLRLLQLLGSSDFFLLLTTIGTTNKETKQKSLRNLDK